MDNSLIESFKKDMLTSDFQQCMEMLRHYDNINWDLTKFSFGQLLVVIGACWTILVHEKEDDETLMNVLNDGTTNIIVGCILLLSTAFVFLTLVAILRNRCYFVLVSRYINEHRHNFLMDKPYDFANESKMWQNSKFPKLIDWKSTQFAFVYLFSFLCIMLLFFSLHCLLLDVACGFSISIIITIILIAAGGFILYKIVN